MMIQGWVGLFTRRISKHIDTDPEWRFFLINVGKGQRFWSKQGTLHLPHPKIVQIWKKKRTSSVLLGILLYVLVLKRKCVYINFIRIVIDDIVIQNHILHNYSKHCYTKFDT